MKRTSILLVLLVLSTTRGYASNAMQFNAFSQGNPAFKHTETLHNVTLDCGGWNQVAVTVVGCQRDLRQLMYQGYPWRFQSSQANARAFNGTQNTAGLRDVLDALNYVCHTMDRSRTCLHESGISRDYCLLFTGGLVTQAQFEFICGFRKRDENLVRSLQCLHNTRVLVMLYFHIGNHCDMDILDELMTRMKKAYFYLLNVNPPWNKPSLFSLYCLSKSDISKCVNDIVEEHCGAMAAELFKEYVIYMQNRHDQALKSAGLSANICDHNLSSSQSLDPSPNSSGNGKRGMLGLPGFASPGTALDTVWGKYVGDYLQNLSGDQLCSVSNAFDAFVACVMSADDAGERNKFNILQLGHKIIPVMYHGTQCNRLEQFTECWNLLQETCGTMVRGLAQYATLFIEGCRLQSDMDTAGCHWQDMLLRYYIQAGSVTAWPLTIQGIPNPMNIESGHYKPSVTKDLKRVISILQPGIDEISRKCGRQPANRLQTVFAKLSYQQYDAFRYTALMHDKLRSIEHENSTRGNEIKHGKLD